MSYYAILGVEPSAAPPEIKAAFHGFAMRCHPDKYLDDDAEVSLAAAEVFKRGVEAYGVLSRPDRRARYDAGLKKGRLRLDPNAPPSVPPPPQIRTLEMIATTPSGKANALKADRLISIGKLEEARIPLVTACQHEPGNEELKDRLGLLYEAMALEPQ